MKTIDTTIARQLKAVSRAMKDLDGAVRKLTLVAALNGPPSARPKLKLSPKRRAALKLQGSYLGYMRQLKARQKAAVRAVREKKGMRAAIAVAKRLAGGS